MASTDTAPFFTQHVFRLLIIIITIKKRTAGGTKTAWRARERERDRGGRRVVFVFLILRAHRRSPSLPAPLASGTSPIMSWPHLNISLSLFLCAAMMPARERAPGKGVDKFRRRAAEHIFYLRRSSFHLAVRIGRWESERARERKYACVRLSA